MAGASRIFSLLLSILIISALFVAYNRMGTGRHSPPVSIPAEIDGPVGTPMSSPDPVILTPDTDVEEAVGQQDLAAVRK